MHTRLITAIHLFMVQFLLFWEETYNTGPLQDACDVSKFGQIERQLFEDFGDLWRVICEQTTQTIIIGWFMHSAQDWAHFFRTGNFRGNSYTFSKSIDISLYKTFQHGN